MVQIGVGIQRFGVVAVVLDIAAVAEHFPGVLVVHADGIHQMQDFAAGIAVMSLGYQNKELEESLTEQIKKLCHTSNLFYHENGGGWRG